MLPSVPTLAFFFFFLIESNLSHRLTKMCSCTAHTLEGTTYIFSKFLAVSKQYLYFKTKVYSV